MQSTLIFQTSCLTIIDTEGNAKKILLLGGNVEIAPDGYFGTKMLTYELFGKARGFSIGFAELASSTNSCVLPVGIDVNEQGIITINIWPLLQANKEDTEQGNLTFLVDYYVNYLRKCWNNSPHMITHGHMLKFIKANEGI